MRQTLIVENSLQATGLYSYAHTHLAAVPGLYTWSRYEKIMRVNRKTLR